MKRVRSVAVAAAACLASGCAHAPERSDDSILQDFLAGKRRLPAGDGRSFLLAKSPGPCAELPAARPEGFQINYVLHRGDRPELIPPRFAVGDRECEVIWRELHIGVPGLRCTLLAPAATAQLYRELQALAPHTIHTRVIEASPHRGGFAVAWHWPGHACEVSDVGDSEIVATDDPRFRSLVGWLRGACQSVGTTDCP